MEKITPRMGGLDSRLLKKPATVVRVPWAVPERWISIMATDWRKLVFPR